MSKWVCDFETTTDENDCRVWACAICNIENIEEIYISNCEDLFYNFSKSHAGDTFYFHNLKFDGEFIIHWLFRNGFSWKKEKKKLKEKEFSTLISDTAQFYSISICFKNKVKIEILDSLKILPISVEEIAKAFNLPEPKGEIDYNKYRPVGYVLDENEKDYIRKDVQIVAQALKIMFDMNLKKMTQGSNALHDFKEIIQNKYYDKWFPILSVPLDKELRRSYKGGFTYCDPRKKGVECGSGIILDVNSLYPFVMYSKMLPYGEPVFFNGKYEFDKDFPLSISKITFNFEIKKDKIPCIQIKNSIFVENEYLTDDGGNEVTMVLTNIDWNLIQDQYDVYNVIYHHGWKFKASDQIFKKYIDKWRKVKEDATIEGNPPLRFIAKRMMNSLYGKFGLNPITRSKIPFVNENGILKFKYSDFEERKPVYIPIASFITSYAREITIRSAQEMYPYFRYADTDSLHLEMKIPTHLLEMTGKEIEKLNTDELIRNGLVFPDDFNIDPVKLGAWKCEGIFTKAKYLRQKCYFEEIEGKNKIAVAGMPKNCYQFVTWENFKIGSSYRGKLQPKHVKNGVILAETEFTIKK